MSARTERRIVTGPTGAPQDVLVNFEESPLAWLRTRRGRNGEALIDPDEFEAGERLRRDFTIAGLMARTTMDWDAFAAPSGTRRGGGGPGKGLLVSEAAMSARGRVTAALRSVGPDLADVLVDVCCHLKGLTEIERRHEWPTRSGKVVLRLGLAALARHYGIGSVAQGTATTRSRHWGTTDYKPKA